MGYKTLEHQLITYCAPTLADLKTANLFAYQYTSDQNLVQAVDFWNRCMQEKGIVLTILKRSHGSALIYVYRPSRLRADLSREDALAFMRQCGYCEKTPETGPAIHRLVDRLHQNSDFPHEIGMFLGYPLEDVMGFIENKGKNCKCCGCWKVYGDETAAKQAFARFGKCRDVYLQLWNQGRSVLQLTVNS